MRDLEFYSCSLMRFKCTRSMYDTRVIFFYMNSAILQPWVYVILPWHLTWEMLMNGPSSVLQASDNAK